MLSKILGVIWIFLGVAWLVKPEMLKNRLKKKMSRRMRMVVNVFILVFGFLLIGSVIKTPGFITKVIGIIGLILTIKAIMLITSKTSEKVFEWWASRPIIFFRGWALFVLITGLMLMFV
ncbi:hypothetical protein ACFL5Y_01960 [Candidatus Omnitrophota bacterium]